MSAIRKVMSAIPVSEIPTLSLLYRLKRVSPAARTHSGVAPLQPSSTLNDKIGLIKGDITELEVDAIVNAANERLAGGAGVDGAIHRAAGRQLLLECRQLRGCETGSAKITNAYRLPCKKVIHAVGPIYDVEGEEESAKLLAGCYTTSLGLAVENDCKTVAFSSISTGTYGYPSDAAASVAIQAVKAFLEGKDGSKLEKVTFCTFASKDDVAYHKLLPLKSNGQVDFSNPASVQQLTKSLLKRDFGLKIDLPEDRLCPPVPNRLNYIYWIQDLLDTTNSFSEIGNLERSVLGLDIGTGASYIDEKSLKYAKQNVEVNQLQTRIRLLQTKHDGSLIPLDEFKFDNIDFTMCNPPFYESTNEMLVSAESKQRPPFSACTGSETEMVTPGGEVAFISRIIDESLVLQSRVQWYTSMLGKLSSVGVLIKKLRDNDIDNYAVTEFIQGNKTRRWAIAWSFEDMRPRIDIARGLHSLPKALLPFPSEYIITLTERSDFNQIKTRLNDTMSRLSLKWIWKENIATGLALAEKDVWSRASRRASRRSQEHTSKLEKNEDEDEEADIALAVKIRVEEPEGESLDPKTTICWLKGHDTVLFESFCGMLKRKLDIKVES
ncbi:hypothetical protein B7463_g7887, partial [Scytalidium lignicola]